MDPDSIILSEVSHTDKDKYCMLSFLCGILKKMNTHSRKKTQNYKHRKQKPTNGYHRKEGGEG